MMTSDETPITSKEDLNAELHALLQRAHENGVDVRGAYESRNGAEHPDFELVVTEVEKPNPSE